MYNYRQQCAHNIMFNTDMHQYENQQISSTWHYVSTYISLIKVPVKYQHVQQEALLLQRNRATRYVS